MQATSLLSLNPLQTTPWLSESEKYSLLHTQREIELTESEKYTVGGGVGERLHATSSLVVVAGQVKPALQSEHHTLPFLFHTTTLLLCHKLDFYKQYFSKLYFYTTPCLSFFHTTTIHTSALPHSEPTQNKSDTLFTKLCMHFVDFVKLSSVSSQRQKYYTCHIGFGTTGQQQVYFS